MQKLKGSQTKLYYARCIKNKVRQNTGKDTQKKKIIVIVVQFKVKPCTYYSVQHADLPDHYYTINVHKAHAQNTRFSSVACIQQFFPDIIS